MKLETRRLIMRKFQEQDIEDAYRYLSDAQVMYYIEEPYTKEQTEEFLQSYGMCGEPLIYALVEKVSNCVIGHIIFHPYDTNEIYEVGFILNKEKQHLGYGTEIVQALIDYAFDVMRLHKLVAETVEGNCNSMRLLERLHFRQEAVFRKQNWDHGQWIDEYHYGLLKSDWMEDNI